MNDKKILLIGATGVFGRRLAYHLSRMQEFTILLASRDLERAQSLAQFLRQKDSASALVPLAFDRSMDFSGQLSRIQPWLVIDASGPFQTASYDLAESSLGVGSHFIDLADAAAYLQGFEAKLDRLAREKQLVAVTGASSTPALSFAAVNALVGEWQRVDTVDISILPGGKSEVGLSVIHAILSYAGLPVPTWSEGRPDTVIGWGSSRQVQISGFGNRNIAPVETADARMLSNYFKVKSRVSFSAGLESRLEHFGLIALANMRQWGLISNLAPLAPLLQKARLFTRLTTNDCGFMIVQIAGLDAEGLPTNATWQLNAAKGDGPHVPILPTLALIRALFRGEISTGARVCENVIKLGAIELEMAPLKITTFQTIKRRLPQGIFEQAVGSEKYQHLPPAVRVFHNSDSAALWAGESDIEVGLSWLARIVRRFFGMPEAGASVPVHVSVDRCGSREIWVRNFAGNRFKSTLDCQGNDQITEAFGWFIFSLNLQSTPDGLYFSVSRWKIGRLPLPKFLAPVSVSREYQDGKNRFCFDIRLSIPWIGLLVHYHGWLMPVE